MNRHHSRRMALLLGLAAALLIGLLAACGDDGDKNEASGAPARANVIAPNATPAPPVQTVTRFNDGLTFELPEGWAIDDSMAGLHMVAFVSDPDVLAALGSTDDALNNSLETIQAPEEVLVDRVSGEPLPTEGLLIGTIQIEMDKATMGDGTPQEGLENLIGWEGFPLAHTPVTALTVNDRPAGEVTIYDDAAGDAGLSMTALLIDFDQVSVAIGILRPTGEVETWRPVVDAIAQSIRIDAAALVADSDEIGVVIGEDSVDVMPAEDAAATYGPTRTLAPPPGQSTPIVIQAEPATVTPQPDVASSSQTISRFNDGLTVELPEGWAIDDSMAGLHMVAFVNDPDVLAALGSTDDALSSVIETILSPDKVLVDRTSGEPLPTANLIMGTIKLELDKATIGTSTPQEGLETLLGWEGFPLDHTPITALLINNRPAAEVTIYDADAGDAGLSVSLIVIDFNEVSTAMGILLPYGDLEAQRPVIYDIAGSIQIDIAALAADPESDYLMTLEPTATQPVQPRATSLSSPTSRPFLPTVTPTPSPTPFLPFPTWTPTG